MHDNRPEENWDANPGGLQAAGIHSAAQDGFASRKADITYLV